jgi:hypothetical protein
VSPDDPGGDREPKPGATRRRVGGTPEPIEDPRQVFVANPSSLVLDRQDRPPVRDTDLDAHAPALAGGGVADRVVHEKMDELAQPCGIGDEGHRLSVDLQLDALS